MTPATTSTSAAVALDARREADLLQRENVVLRGSVTRLERRNRELVRIIVELGGEGHEALRGGE